MIGEAHTTVAETDPRRAVAAAMTAAVTAWLDTLTEDQRSAALFDSPLVAEADAERLRWYYTPTDHGGLALREQSAAQQRLAMQLVASGLSEAGYATVATVVGLENVLDQVEGWKADWARERGRDPELYWLRLFGTPGSPVWGWRFGGHHISLNYLIVDGCLVSTTPCFLGADPASTALLGGSPLRPLGGIEDVARNLARSFTAEQREQALLHESAISDIVSGNRARVTSGDTMMHMQDLWRGQFADPALNKLVDDIDRRAEAASGYREADHAALAFSVPPKGICARSLDATQRSDLRRLIALYTGRAPAAMAAVHAARYASDAVLDVTWFGWAGGMALDDPHYYRIQGPDLLIEYDNTQRRANHAHSVWRDLSADFGFDALAEHRRHHSH
ncbi:Protein of unknown function (DUF3500) [Nocardia amikacinitolerans]|uniref:DUF3500 domain-containing protein n=1 Tax=Nocardia amikacinitolerans TaxID=756689 RepID=UPI000832792F|nr:DUF3500 domain-containing protein [Nocardia amikacinitolerans]MCP2315980.1 Protein of unknown function (DUF3500) [Nocardia amikacinitolerans]